MASGKGSRQELSNVLKINRLLGWKHGIKIKFPSKNKVATVLLTHLGAGDKNHTSQVSFKGQSLGCSGGPLPPAQEELEQKAGGGKPKVSITCQGLLPRAKQAQPSCKCLRILSQVKELSSLLLPSDVINGSSLFDRTQAAGSWQLSCRYGTHVPTQIPVVW